MPGGENLVLNAYMSSKDLKRNLCRHAVLKVFPAQIHKVWNYRQRSAVDNGSDCRWVSDCRSRVASSLLLELLGEGSD